MSNEVLKLDENGSVEIWKPCILSNGKFEVSSFGRVRGERHKKIIKGTPNRGGRIRHAVWITGGSRKAFQEHRMIAAVFVPGRSAERDCVNHKDGNCKNNHPSNLEWVNHSENQRHAHHVLGLCRGEKGSNAKLNEDQVLSIYTMTMGIKRMPKYTYPSISKAFGIKPGQIGVIKRGIKWSWLYQALFGGNKEATNSAREI